MNKAESTTGFYSVIVRTILAGMSIVNASILVLTLGSDLRLIQSLSLFFGLVASILYYLDSFTKAEISREMAIGLLFLNSCAVAFLFDLNPAPSYVFLGSFVASILVYNYRPIIRAAAIVHIVAALLCCSLGSGSVELPLLPYLVLSTITLVYVISSSIKIRSNERYYVKMNKLRQQLNLKRKAIKEKTRKFLDQSEMLKESQRDLEYRILENKERVAHLQGANSELEQIAKAASRDLKAPLRAVGVNIGQLGQRLDRLDRNDGLSDYLHYVTEGASRMNAMVDDLLQYCNPRTKKPAENICTQHVLQMIESNLSNLMLREGARLDVQKDMPVVLGHRTEILQLFQNLISNGIKFRKPGETPVCRVGFTRKDQEICFYVSDNGIGIPANRVGDVFGLFTRLHERGNYEGTGIGLALCRRIVLAAGGEIWAKSEEGKGTTFFFTWPLTSKDVILTSPPMAA